MGPGRGRLHVRQFAHLPTQSVSSLGWLVRPATPAGRGSAHQQQSNSTIPVQHGPTSRGFSVGSVIKKRRKRMAKKKHRKLLKKTRIQRRRAGK